MDDARQIMLWERWLAVANTRRGFPRALIKAIRMIRARDQALVDLARHIIRGDQYKDRCGELSIELIQMRERAERAEADVKRLNAWADGFEAAAMKERLAAGQVINELRSAPEKA